MNRAMRRAMVSENPSFKGAGHTMVAELAAKMALTIYAERCRRDPMLDRSDRAARLWASKEWPMFRQEARTTLAGMLNGNTDQSLKDQIFQALLLDAQIPEGAVRPVQMKMDL